MSAYDAGEYETAEARLRALLDRDPPIANQALVIEIHKYLGATLMFLGRRTDAEKQFETLLRLDPDYELDPVLFPTDILDTFYKVKLGIADELAAIKKKKADEAAKATAEKEARKADLKKKIIEASKPVYLSSSKLVRHPIVALVPFGVGQLQNGQALKGFLFMGGEAGLLAANIALYAMSEFYKSKFRESTARWTAYKKSFANFKIATNITAGVLIAAMVAGIIDALVYFVRLGKEPSAYVPVKEQDVPPDLKRTPLEIPDEDLDSILGISLALPIGGAL